MNKPRTPSPRIKGDVEISKGRNGVFICGDPWSYTAIETCVLKLDGSRWGTTLGFKTTETPAGESILFPDWFPIFLLGFLGYAPWNRHLRSLLIATTMV